MPLSLPECAAAAALGKVTQCIATLWLCVSAADVGGSESGLYHYCCQVSGRGRPLALPPLLLLCLLCLGFPQLFKTHRATCRCVRTPLRLHVTTECVGSRSVGGQFLGLTSDWPAATAPRCHLQTIQALEHSSSSSSRVGSKTSIAMTAE